ncbi:MAG TPA: hypothetical protein VK783_08325 [Bacteroidia bacterium]|nr:hypothetical protein [Bacteroidia bacterium]
MSFIKNLKYLFFITLSAQSICSTAQSNNYNDSVYSIMMHKCEEFVENYKPTYITKKGDTLVTARYTMPPSDINTFIFNCIKKNDFKPLKFSAIIFLLQNYEFMNAMKEDYPLNVEPEFDYKKNGFIQMMRIAMYGNKAMNTPCGPTYSNEVCKWIKVNKNKIYDSSFITNTFSKLTYHTKSITNRNCNNPGISIGTGTLIGNPIFEEDRLKVKIDSTGNEYKIMAKGKGVPGIYYIKLHFVTKDEKDEHNIVIQVICSRCH